MSRTLRRNKRYLIELTCGTLEEIVRDGGYWWLSRYKGLTAEQAYIRHVHRFTSDSGFKWSVPSWFTRLRTNRPERMFARAEVRRCMRNDEWDDHVLHRGYCRPWYW